jgi:hypothetical protein
MLPKCRDQTDDKAQCSKPKASTSSLGKPILPGLTKTSAEFQSATLQTFVSPLYWTVFHLLNVTDISWLCKPPSLWDDSEAYKKLNTFVSNLLYQQYCRKGLGCYNHNSKYVGIITKDDSQILHVQQTVEQHRKTYPNAQKYSTFK